MLKAGLWKSRAVEKIGMEARVLLFVFFSGSSKDKKKLFITSNLSSPYARKVRLSGKHARHDRSVFTAETWELLGLGVHTD